ncbi:hypothetical protein ACIHDR_42245 [Nocardia sp. NPDC052278]|uniref:hypothetical protein n=1 Tax=Nocardia sp. NPDC052278 TaxID=3364328 RepID=UPI0037CB03C6
MGFAVLAAAAQIERNYIREKTLEGQATAAAKGNHGGRPKVIDEDMLTFAQVLKDKICPVGTAAISFPKAVNGSHRMLEASNISTKASAALLDSRSGSRYCTPRQSPAKQ